LERKIKDFLEQVPKNGSFAIWDLKRTGSAEINRKTGAFFNRL